MSCYGEFYSNYINWQIHNIRYSQGYTEISIGTGSISNDMIVLLWVYFNHDRAISTYELHSITDKGKIKRFIHQGTYTQSELEQLLKKYSIKSTPKTDLKTLIENNFINTSRRNPNNQDVNESDQKVTTNIVNV
ncbi:hypothetical protein J4455_02275 [Candidatus Woesearchaeota archaeon]|nr:hypothetical protein [Candidatus Woesearchaeota archaeon]